MTAFQCSQCGACCRNLAQHDMYRFLDRGDGICKNLDITSNLCKIYEDRPLICRVDQSYEFFSDLMSLEEYHQVNEKNCEILRTKG